MQKDAHHRLFMIIKKINLGNKLIEIQSYDEILHSHLKRGLI